MLSLLLHFNCSCHCGSVFSSNLWFNRKFWEFSILIEIFLCIDDEKWTVDEFLERSEETCRCAAIELNRKSNMVSEAVEEVLSLVQNATQVFKSMIGAENSLLVQGRKLD